MSEQPQILIYEDAEKAVDVRLDEGRETVWLTQRQMGEVFETTPENVLMHLKNIFNDEELAEEATAKDFLVVRQEGRREVHRKIQHYDLDAIISVGYRVNSRRAVRFRQWATRVLREHLIQGWTLHQQRFEANARELEAAMAVVRKAAHSSALDLTGGRGLVDIVARYAQIFWSPTRRPMKSRIQRWPACL
ncbi:virulence RhuM family protein [Salinicola lusitanus]|uniref:virulence RhuM family protein n=1 Tax=Salinicola lusitanus TaxID=1949085 RepID=UPI000DA19625|nr:RhuM family protein [Salinicola lusitanus]